MDTVVNGYPNFVYQLLSHTWKTPVPYLFGGYTPAGWDCSGFVGYVLTQQFGLILPGFFKGAGPFEVNTVWHPTFGYHPSPAGAYKVWRYAETVTDGSMIPGDLLVWDTHIGVAVGDGVMVSALSEAYATAVTPVSGFGPSGQSMITRRIKVGHVT